MADSLFDAPEPTRPASPEPSSSRRDFLRHLAVAGASVASLPLLEVEGQAKPSPFPRLVRSRVPFPHDRDLSIYVGVSSKWRGYGFSTHPLMPPFKPQPIKSGELITDFAAFPLTEKPTLKEFDRLLISKMQLLDDPEWYAFEPEEEDYHLIFDVRDTQKRLGKIVITDLKTGKVLGLRHSNRERTVIRGKLLFPWTQTYCLIEGYDLCGEMLFRGIASNGQPDTWVHFTQVQQFAAYRPPTTPPAPLKESELVCGLEGDPFNLKGLNVPGQPILPSSIGSGWHEQTNDMSVSNPMRPHKVEYLHKKRWLLVGIAPFFRSNDRLATPPLYSVFSKTQEENIEPAFSLLDNPPYSHNVGHWLGKYFVRTTAFLVVPYAIARNERVYNRIRAVFDHFAKETKGVSDKFAEGLVNTFYLWLESEAGKQSGLKQGMVRSADDIKMLHIEEISKRLVVSRPLYQETFFTVEVISPDPPKSVNGKLSLEIISPSPSVPDSPPPPSTRYYTLDFVNGKAELRLPKGWLCLVKGEITDPPGYTITRTEIKFDSGSSIPVYFPAILSHCLTLKIETDLPADIVIKTKDGLSLYSGATHRDKGKNIFTALTVPPDTYSVFATERKSGKKSLLLKKSERSIQVSPDQEQLFPMRLIENWGK